MRPPVTPPTPDVLTRLTAELAEQAGALDKKGDFPHDNLARLQQLGWLSLACHDDTDLPTLQRVISAIAQGEPSTALIVCMQYLHHLRLADNDSWPSALRQQVTESAREKGALINSLRVEPELGSPARGGLPQTVATRTPQGWRINGHKIYTTGIEGLSWLALWARSDDPTPQVGVWLVPRESEGIRVVKSWDHIGMRASGSHEVILTDVRVPLENAVDTFAFDQPPTANAEQTRLFANRHTALLAAIYDGIARAATQWLIGWLRHRVPGSFGHPLATLPRVQESVGQIDEWLLVNQSLLRQAAALALTTEQANLAKVTITQHAVQVVEKALSLTGNHGLTRDNPLERHYRNVLCGRVHTPQQDSAWIAAGRQSLTQQDYHEKTL